MLNNFVRFMARWQESSLWLPLLVLLVLGAWLVLGALDRTATADALAVVLNLPIITAYALAALALTHLARRRWRYKMSDDEQKQWWQNLIGNSYTSKGPIVVLIVDGVLTMVTLCALLLFFSHSL